MHIEVLKTFCDLIETRSFALAADRNFVTQSAVSQQIRTLEDKFALRLLNRGSGQKEICLTPDGKVFYRECKNVLAAFDALCEEMRVTRREVIYPSIKVASVYSIGFYELPPIMREFMTKFPRAKIDLEYSRATRVVRDVLSGKVEIGVIAFPQPMRDLEIVPMQSGRLVLICPASHRYAGRKKIKTKELNGRDFVQFARDLPISKAIDKIFKSYDVKVNIVAEFDNVEIIKCAVESNLGLAIVPRASVIGEDGNERIAIIELAEKDWVHRAGAIYRRSRTLSATAKKLVRILGCACGNQVPPA